MVAKASVAAPTGLCRMFVEHPASLGETYGQHRQVALSYAAPLARAALAAFVHAFLPFLFKTTASMIVKQLNDRMTRRCIACPSGRAHRPDLFAPALAEARSRDQGAVLTLP